MQKMESRLKNHEMWFLKRMQKITRIDKVSNGNLLKPAGVNGELPKVAEKKATKFVWSYYKGTMTSKI